MGIGLLASMTIYCMAAAAEPAVVAARIEKVEITDRQATDRQATVAPPTGAAATSPLAQEALTPVVDTISSPAVVFADESDEDVVGRIRAYVEGIDTLSAAFVQTSPSGALATGKLYLRRPGQARFEYDPPSPLLIVATQGNVYVEDTALGQTDLYPIRQTPLRFLLSRKVDLGDAKVVSIARGVDTVAVTFTSTDDNADGDLSLVLGAPNLQLQEWIVRDPQNGETIVSLQNPVLGGRLDNRLFRAPEAGGAFIKN